MKTDPSAFRFLLCFALLFFGGTHQLRAQQVGPFFHRVFAGAAVEITGYPVDATGPVVIPAEIDGLPVRRIGRYAFKNCKGLTNIVIPDSVTVIDFGAFHGCAGLTDLMISSHVATIAAAAFYGCTGLQSISVAPDNSYFVGIDGVLFSTERSTLLQYPAGKAGVYTIPSGFQYIAYYAFNHCAGLVSVTISDTVTNIDWGAFRGCTGLESLIVAEGNPRYRSIEGVLFDRPQTRLLQYPARKTGDYTIPSTVTFIGYYAFDGCGGLSNVVLPSSLTAIDVGAFSGCSGLTSISLPPGVPTVLAYTFSGCTRLSSINIPESVTEIETGVFYNCAQLPGITLPPGINYIAEEAFFGCSKLTSITIPPNVTRIRAYAFSHSGLASLTIPSSVSSIGDYAFSRCVGLTSLTIPSGVSFIGEYAFSHCAGLNNLVMEPGITYIDEGLFLGCTALTHVTIPGSVTTIVWDAFAHCAGLITITLPSSVTGLFDDVFWDCPNLQSIHVQPGNPSYSSIDGVLFDAMGTTLIDYPQGGTGAYTIPSGTLHIAVWAFEDSAALTRLTIPSSVTNLSNEMFWGCNSLQSIDVKEGNPQYTSAGGVLFDTSQSVLIQYPAGKPGPCIIPFGVTSFGEYAFHSCSGLTSVTLPCSVTSLDAHLFSDCASLASVTLPSSITRIGDEAFINCTSLGSAIFLGNAPEMGGGVFFNTAPGFTIHYLSGRTGFTSPEWNTGWNTYPASAIDATAYPAASWLLAHGFPYDTNLQQDPDGDGVSLLMAYALNLDPLLNLQGSQPVPELGENTFSMSFHATSPGITYRVETSSDLRTWTTTGVTVSAPGPDGRSTASVPITGSRLFLRLMIEN